MSDEYKNLINEKIKDAVNQWIEDLKEKHPELLLTKQWKVHYPKGFVSGHNVISVITGSKSGGHLIGEVQFMLPENLELEIDSVELVLKDEPYIQENKTSILRSVPIDEQLDVINDLVIGINAFIQEFSNNKSVPSSPLFQKTPGNIRVMNQPKSSVSDVNIEPALREIVNSSYLPEWLKTIDSADIRNELIRKTAEALVQYRSKYGMHKTVKEFFDIYTEHLMNQNRLYRYCKYKAKRITFNSQDICTESYCSKKPYNSICQHAALKFGNGAG